MKTFDDLFWTECEILSSDTSFSKSLSEKAWNFQQEKINELQAKIDAIVNLVKNETPDYELDNKIQEILK